MSVARIFLAVKGGENSLRQSHFSFALRTSLKYIRSGHISGHTHMTIRSISRMRVPKMTAKVAELVDAPDSKSSLAHTR